MHLYREKGGVFPSKHQKNFPHPRRFFGFNTSCFWRRKVLYLYRDMGGASAPPFFRHFPFKNGVLEALPVKICLPLIFLCLPQILIGGRLRKTTRRVGKIGRREVFPKVKNVNVESAKKRSKLLDFFVARRSDESRHLLLPFPVLRFLRSLRI